MSKKKRNVGWGSGWTPPPPRDHGPDSKRSAMTEERLNEKYGARLIKIFGPDYRKHKAYSAIVRQAIKGDRTISSILADYEEGQGVSPKSGW